MTIDKDKWTRTQTDWIESFLNFTKGLPTPELFRKWAGISAVAATLERRVWVESAGRQLFPNLFVLMVSPPGVGKTNIIEEVYRLWKQVPELVVAPDNVTKASLVDALEHAKRNIVLSPTEMLEFNSMQVAADELGVFMSAHDLDFLSFINKMYDNPPFYREARRMWGNKALDIVAPQLNILAGTQPGFMASVLPEEAWTMGFTSRLIMIYAGQPVQVPLFDVEARSVAHEKILVQNLRAMMTLHGAFKLTAEAKELIQSWDTNGRVPVPEHSKLEHYIPRRILSLLKLCMVSAISRSNTMTITRTDFERALAWLVEAEMVMPSIFRSMTQKSDAQVILEMHQWAWGIYARKKQPIHESLMLHFLSNKTPADRAPRVLELSEKAGFFKREAGGLTYRPAPRNEIGME